MKKLLYALLLTLLAVSLCFLFGCEESACRHEFGEWQVIEPSCGKAGGRFRTCSLCFEEESEYIPALSHDYRDGVCVNCGNPAIPCDVHDYGMWYIEIHETCVENGVCARKCKICGNKETGDIPKAGHSYDNVYVIKPTTCTEDGEILVSCTECGDTKRETVTTLGHSFDEESVCVNCLEPAFVFEENENGYTVAGINIFYDENIVIPSTFKGKPVTEIKEKAFNFEWNITSVTIPQSVTRIGENAFSRCIRLQTISLPEGLAEIEESAFMGCQELASVTIPQSVTRIGKNEFSRCIRLQTISLPEGLAEIGESAFMWCEALTSITIPQSVTEIGDYAFSGCDNITDVTFEENSEIERVGVMAFSCKNLRFTVKDGVEYLGTVSNKYFVAYKGVDNAATSVATESGCRVIADYCFSSFNKATEISIADTVKFIGKRAFSNCDTVKENAIPDSVISIGEFAFSGCEMLEQLSLGSGVVTIGYSAFVNCTLVKSVTIPDSVVTIGESAFEYCVRLKTLILGKSVERIGASAFYECLGLSAVSIPDSVGYIGESAFAKCNISSITVGDKNESYKSVDGNLYSKDGRTLIQYAIGKKEASFAVPSSVTAIGGKAFYYGGELTSVILGDSVTSIGAQAFANCVSLTSISIPDSVMYIGEEAFVCCTGLESITVGDKNESYKSVGGNLYSKDGKRLIQYAIGNKETTFAVPSGVEEICRSAFKWSWYLTSVSLPDSVIVIGDSAFETAYLTAISIPAGITHIGENALNCSSLTTVEFAGTIEQWKELSKGVFGLYSTPDYIVICSDGRFDKSFNPIY